VSAPAYLELADWRRRIAALYADVRELAATDPFAAWTHWRDVRERLYRDHPQTPLPVAARADFRARHFPYDPALRFTAPVLPDRSPGADATAIPTSAGGSEAFQRVGSVELPFPAGTRTLALFWLPGYAGGLFLSFRDATNGAETYGGGRYLLDAAKSADLGGDSSSSTLILDFNFAYQPSCAFDPQWVCPLIPPENRLDLPVPAGERIA
jgi:uncharacterized protein